MSLERDNLDLIKSSDGSIIIKDRGSITIKPLHRGNESQAVCYYCMKLMKVPMYCSKCSSVTYCSRDCQKKHWSFHKIECGKFPTINITNKYIEDVLSCWDILRAMVDMAIIYNKMTSGYVKCNFDSNGTFITDKNTSHTGKIVFKKYTKNNSNSRKSPGQVFIEVHYCMKGARSPEKYIKCYFSDIKPVNREIKSYFSNLTADIYQPIYFELNVNNGSYDTVLIPCDMTSMESLD